uniref:C-type lectin domain-containing protein n=1 Tax=Maylandia zebra TaxID=106582 RepID=A0A3P9C432_9CICH
MVWRCFVGDIVGDLFKIEGTLIQHGYHSILQRHAIPSGLHLCYDDGAVLLCLMFGWCTCTGYVTLCSPTHREFYLINGAKIWADAQSYCRSNYADLATIGSQDDMQRLVKMVSASGVTAEMWIGLTRTGPPAWLWSVGETQISDGVAFMVNIMIYWLEINKKPYNLQTIILTSVVCVLNT